MDLLEWCFKAPAAAGQAVRPPETQITETVFPPDSGDTPDASGGPQVRRCRLEPPGSPAISARPARFIDPKSENSEKSAQLPQPANFDSSPARPAAGDRRGAQHITGRLQSNGGLLRACFTLPPPVFSLTPCRRLQRCVADALESSCEVGGTRSCRRGGRSELRGRHLCSRVFRAATSPSSRLPEQPRLSRQAIDGAPVRLEPLS